MTDASPSATDDDLVVQVLGGDRECFSVLMRRHNRRLYRVARAIVSDDTEAMDIVQEGYVNAYAHLDQFATKSTFSTWLTRIVINAALARRRSAGRARELAVAPAHGEWLSGSVAINPEDEAAQRELARALEQAIEELPYAYRLALVLRELEGLSTAETATCLGIGEEAVRTRLHRARTLLRADLRRRIGEEVERLFPFGGVRCDAIVFRVMASLA